MDEVEYGAQTAVQLVLLHIRSEGLTRGD